MRHLLWLCCVCVLLATVAQATSFTAANGYADPLTVTVEPGSEDAVITVPDTIFPATPGPLRCGYVLHCRGDIRRLQPPRSRDAD